MSFLLFAPSDKLLQTTKNVRFLFKVLNCRRALFSSEFEMSHVHLVAIRQLQYLIVVEQGNKLDPRDTKSLMALHNHGHPDVRRVVAMLLDRVGYIPGHDEKDLPYWIAKGDFDYCVKIGAPAVKPLIALLKDPSVDRRAIRALGEIGDSRAVGPLTTLIRNPNSSCNDHDARCALGQIGDTRAVWSLIALLKYGTDCSRMHTAEVLGQIGDARAVEPLIALIKDIQHPNDPIWITSNYRPTGHAVETAAEALEQISKRIGGRLAVEAIIQAFDAIWGRSFVGRPRHLERKRHKTASWGLALALKDLYHQGTLDEQSKQRILAFWGPTQWSTHEDHYISECDRTGHTDLHTGLDL